MDVNAKTVKAACENYFSLLTAPKLGDDSFIAKRYTDNETIGKVLMGGRSVAFFALKGISYVTLVVPILMGITLAVSTKLAGRVKAIGGLAGNQDPTSDKAKIIGRGLHSNSSINLPQDIAPISIPIDTVAIQAFGYGVSTTYHPENSTPELDKAGIIDFARVFPECGIAYIADVTGHGNPEKRAQLEIVWNKFNQDFISDYKAQAANLYNDQIAQFMKNHFVKLNKEIENAGTGSTFSLAILIEIRGKKWLASSHVGDSALIHVDIGGCVTNITKADQLEFPSINGNSSIQFDWREVRSGDKIYGVTDGVTDFLPREILHSILLDKDTNEVNFLERIENAIVTSNIKEDRSKGIKEYDPKNKNRSDDISAFVMVVP
jgi:hypothetical protein